MSNAATTTASDFYDVVILGAGYAGLMAALRIGGRKQRPARIALVNGCDQFVERVRGQEAISGPVAARIPSIAALVAGTAIDFIRGQVAALDANGRSVTIATGASERKITFDRAIYALGSRTDLDTVPGVADHAFCLDPGKGRRAVAALRAKLVENAGRRLSVIVVGGNETAVEAAGEIKTTWPDIAVTMISTTRCGDFKGPRVERAARADLESLGVRLIDGQMITAVGATEITAESGETFACDICVWSAGLRGAAIAQQAGISTDRRGRIWVDPNLQSTSHPHITAVGDAAHPVAPTGAPYRMSALAAAASGAYAADVVLARIKLRQPRPFSFSTYGQGVAIGQGGVGFPSYPNDIQVGFIIRGRSAYHVRSAFVWFFAFVLKAERRFPGIFPIVGRRRVSWQRAKEAMLAERTA